MSDISFFDFTKMVTLSSLHPEKSLEVLCYLPFRSLIEFADAQNNRALQSCSLSKLRLDSLGVYCMPFKTWRHDPSYGNDSRRELSPQRANNSFKE